MVPRRCFNPSDRDNPGEGRLVTTRSQIARSGSTVKKTVLSSCRKQLAPLFDEVFASGKALEEAVWSAVVEVGRQVLEAMLALACWRVVQPEFDAKPGARLRLDRDYTVSQTTTFGTVNVPLFAYREPSGKTKSPAKPKVFPLHPRCRSSELCLE